MRSVNVHQDVSLYREYPPPPLLHGRIECFWERDVHALGGHVHRVLPDGCIDVLFECEGISAATSYVVGAMTRPLLVARSDAMHVFAVRFKPGAAAEFFRPPLFHLTDARIDLCDLWSHPLGLVEQVCAATTSQERINLVAQELMCRLSDKRPTQRKVTLALQTLALRPDRSIEQLCRELGITRQGLAKGFRNSVGLSPKMLARILRMRIVLKHIHRSQRRPILWRDVAQCAGYYDQAHMINEFQALNGLTPQQVIDEDANPVSISPIL
jgi:AraC-like DNA-binding protein